MDLKKIAFQYLLNQAIDDEDSTSDDSAVEDEIEEDILHGYCAAEKRKRNCIPNYFENVVPLYSEDEFKMHFRINEELFKELAAEFKNSAEFQSITENYNNVTSEKHLAVFLWFAGHEACSYRDLADRFDLSLWTVHKIIYRVTTFLSNMSPNVIKWPSIDRRRQSSEYFLEKYNFPGVIGSIDGTHIIIDPPSKNKDDYIDRKGNVSLCVQGICDENNKLIDVFIGYPGSVHDSRLLKNSPVYSELPQLIEEGHYLLGDSAYPCLLYLMVPYRDNGHLTRAQKHFNLVLSKIRVQIEHTFGMLKQRFRQLYYCKLKSIKILCHFIRACCVLHNLADKSDIDLFQNEQREDDNEEPMHYEDGNENGSALRNQTCRQLFDV